MCLYFLFRMERARLWRPGLSAHFQFPNAKCGAPGPESELLGDGYNGKVQLLPLLGDGYDWKLTGKQEWPFPVGPQIGAEPNTYPNLRAVAAS